MALSYSRRLEQLHKLNEELAEAPNKPVFTDGYVLSGLLSKFKIAFDVSWKLMKDILVDGYAIVDFPKGSPREVISKALYNGIVREDDVWLRMLKLRNQLSHIYDGELAEDAARTVIDEFIPALAKFEREARSLIASLDG